METGADETQTEQELSLQLHIKRELEDDDSRDGTQTGDFFGEVAQLPKRPRTELEQEHSRDPESSAHRDVYRCQTCTKVFSNPANVNRHARSCSGAARAVGLELTQAEFFPNPEQSPFIHQPKREEILQQPPPSPLPGRPPPRPKPPKPPSKPPPTRPTSTPPSAPRHPGPQSARRAR